MTDPRGDLVFAAEEALVLHDVFYPGAVLLGDMSGFECDMDGPPLSKALPVTPAAFLAHVPGADTAGASLLHLSCHATLGSTAEASRLKLTEHLPIDTVLRDAAHRALNTPGGTVVLTSCISDLTAVDYDEALTLATAFLAAGAVTVIGSLGRPTTAVPRSSCSRRTTSSAVPGSGPPKRCAPPNSGCSTALAHRSPTCPKP